MTDEELEAKIKAISFWSGKNSMTIEATGAWEKLAAMEDLLRAYGIKELARTGKIALSRGSREGTTQG